MPRPGCSKWPQQPSQSESEEEDDECEDESDSDSETEEDVRPGKKSRPQNNDQTHQVRKPGMTMYGRTPVRRPVIMPSIRQWDSSVYKPAHKFVGNRPDTIFREPKLGYVPSVRLEKQWHSLPQKPNQNIATTKPAARKHNVASSGPPRPTQKVRQGPVRGCNQPSNPRPIRQPGRPGKPDLSMYMPSAAMKKRLGLTKKVQKPKRTIYTGKTFRLAFKKAKLSWEPPSEQSPFDTAKYIRAYQRVAELFTVGSHLMLPLVKKGKQKPKPIAEIEPKDNPKATAKVKKWLVQKEPKISSKTKARCSATVEAWMGRSDHNPLGKRGIQGTKIEDPTELPGSDDEYIVIRAKPSDNTPVNKVETKINKEEANINKKETKINNEETKINKKETKINNEETKINKKETKINKEETNVKILDGELNGSGSWESCDDSQSNTPPKHIESSCVHQHGEYVSVHVPALCIGNVVMTMNTEAYEVGVRVHPHTPVFRNRTNWGLRTYRSFSHGNTAATRSVDECKCERRCLCAQNLRAFECEAEPPAQDCVARGGPGFVFQNCKNWIVVECNHEDMQREKAEKAMAQTAGSKVEPILVRNNAALQSNLEDSCSNVNAPMVETGMVQYPVQFDSRNDCTRISNTQNASQNVKKSDCRCQLHCQCPKQYNSGTVMSHSLQQGKLQIVLEKVVRTVGTQYTVDQIQETVLPNTNSQPPESDSFFGNESRGNYRLMQGSDQQYHAVDRDRRGGERERQEEDCHELQGRGRQMQGVDHSEERRRNDRHDLHGGERDSQDRGRQLQRVERDWRGGEEMQRNDRYDLLGGEHARSGQQNHRVDCDRRDGEREIEARDGCEMQGEHKRHGGDREKLGDDQPKYGGVGRDEGHGGARKKHNGDRNNQGGEQQKHRSHQDEHRNDREYRESDGYRDDREKYGDARKSRRGDRENQGGDRQNHAGGHRSHRGDREDQGGDRQKRAGDRGDEGGDRQNHAGGHRSHRGDREDQGGDRQMRADEGGDRQNHAGGHRSHGGDREDQGGDRQKRAGNRGDEGGDRQKRAGGQEDKGRDRQKSAVGRRSHRGDREDQGGDRQKRVSDREDQGGDRQKRAGDREGQGGDRQKSAGGHRSHRGDREDQGGDRQKRAGDREDQGGDRQKRAGDREDQRGDRHKRAGDREDQRGDRHKRAGDREDEGGDRQNHAGGHRSHRGGQEDQGGDRQKRAGDREDQRGDRHKHAGDREDEGGDRQNHAGGHRSHRGGQEDQGGDRQNHAGGHRSHRGGQEDQGGDRQKRAGDRGDEGGDRQKRASDRKDQGGDREKQAGDREDQGGDRQKSAVARRSHRGYREDQGGDREKRYGRDQIEGDGKKHHGDQDKHGKAQVFPQITKQGETQTPHFKAVLNKSKQALVEKDREDTEPEKSHYPESLVHFDEDGPDDSSSIDLSDSPSPSEFYNMSTEDETETNSLACGPRSSRNNRTEFTEHFSFSNAPYAAVFGYKSAQRPIQYPRVKSGTAPTAADISCYSRPSGVFMRRTLNQAPNRAPKPFQPTTNRVKDDGEPVLPSENKKDKKKKPLVKTVDLTVEAHVGGYSTHEIDICHEKECKMISGDRQEKERVDARNALEEYVYDLRGKLSSEDDLASFVPQAERTALCQDLDKTEQWLYAEGEDCARNMYFERLTKLKVECEPIKSRRIEYDSRPAAMQDLSQYIQLTRKAIDMYNAGDERYNHLTPAEIEKVTSAVNSSYHWLEATRMQFAAADRTTSPPVLCSKLKEEKQTSSPTDPKSSGSSNHNQNPKPVPKQPVMTMVYYLPPRKVLEQVVGPILNKPKPVVEPPPPPKKDDEAHEAQGDHTPRPDEATENMDVE